MGEKRPPQLFAFAVLLAQVGSDSDPLSTLRSYATVFLICFGVAFLIALCLSSALAYFMYSDAKARGEKAVLWGIVGFFGGLLGLLVWFIIRPEKKTVP
jgi:hypothetical protein